MRKGRRMADPESPGRDALSPPSRLYSENRERLAKAAQLGPILDLACGRGRHALAAAEQGLRVVALDRKRAFLHELKGLAVQRELAIDCLETDLEAGGGIPLVRGSFGAVMVFRYLHRPLAEDIAACLKPGGLLFYETFTLAQREFEGGPSNPRFLLDPDELPSLFSDLEVISYHERIEQSGGMQQAYASLLACRPQDG
jgi:tellurite methyltransferase